MSAQGVSNRGDERLCMVIGCPKVALYRNATSAAVRHTKRGYCAAHRHLALQSKRTQVDYAERVARWNGDES